MWFPDPIKLDPRELQFEVLASYGKGVPKEGRYALDYIYRARDIINNLPEGKGEGYALADALSNCKTAIEYQIDVVLYSIGLEVKGRANFPRKREILKKIGVTAPSILDRVNQTRNRIAHDHYLPEKEEAQNAIDVAELFYYSTNRLSKLFINSMTILKDKEELFSITYSGNEIFLEIPTPNLKQELGEKPDIVKWMTTPEGPEKEKLRKEREEYYTKKFQNEYITKRISFEENQDLFLKWLAFMIKMQS